MTCETQVQLNARHGKKRAASAEVYTRRGDAEHARRHKQVMRVHAKARRASADSRCFIATAVYGESAWETEQLRLWRDRCLRSSVLGRLFIALYEPQHRVAGGIQGRDRQGREMFFPYMSLSIAVVPVAPGAFQSRHEIASVLSELKGVAKRTPGNSLYVDRRQATEGLAACCPAPGAS